MNSLGDLDVAVGVAGDREKERKARGLDCWKERDFLYFFIMNSTFEPLTDWLIFSIRTRHAQRHEHELTGYVPSTHGNDKALTCKLIYIIRLLFRRDAYTSPIPNIEYTI